MKSILVFAAHPDDETLGCGGTIAGLTESGAIVHIVFLADGVGSRANQTSLDSSELTIRRKAAEHACKILGAQKPEFKDFPDNQLDTVPLLKLTQVIEKYIDQYRPDTVFTHHAGDLNIDHRCVHQAVVTACRPQPNQTVRKLLFFEVMSSTEWQTPGSASVFTPNVFIDISQTLDKKIAALHAYEVEMRKWPHARSMEAVKHYNCWRGASVGIDAAEAFMLGREIL